MGMDPAKKPNDMTKYELHGKIRYRCIDTEKDDGINCIVISARSDEIDNART